MYLRLSAILFAFAALLCLAPQAVAKDYPSRKQFGRLGRP